VIVWKVENYSGWWERLDDLRNGTIEKSQGGSMILACSKNGNVCGSWYSE
jgi:hypothetical protein